MGVLQIIVVFIAVGLNALDGFDVMSISFASIGIQKEWHIDKGTLGAVLSMELIGMAAGSILLGGLADRIGRRRTVLGCLGLMTVGMFMATRSSGVYDLSFWRVLTGLGIGGVLAAVNALTAEFSNARRRDACVSFMSIGYPLGAVFGGVIVAQLLKTHDWRSVFYFGSAFTATLIPLVWFLVPESVHWLVRKQPANALTRINRAMQRMGFPAVDSLPLHVTGVPRGTIWDIFAPALIGTPSSSRPRTSSTSRRSTSSSSGCRPLSRRWASRPRPPPACSPGPTWAVQPAARSSASSPTSCR